MSGSLLRGRRGIGLATCRPFLHGGMLIGARASAVRKRLSRAAFRTAGVGMMAGAGPVVTSRTDVCIRVTTVEERDELVGLCPHDPDLKYGWTPCGRTKKLSRKCIWRFSRGTQTCSVAVITYIGGASSHAGRRRGWLMFCPGGSADDE